LVYERWIDEAEEEGLKILRIDTENKNFEKNEKDLNLIVEYILEMERQSWLNVD